MNILLFDGTVPLNILLFDGTLLFLSMFYNRLHNTYSDERTISHNPNPSIAFVIVGSVPLNNFFPVIKLAQKSGVVRFYDTNCAGINIVHRTPQFSLLIKMSVRPNVLTPWGGEHLYTCRPHPSPRVCDMGILDSANV